MLKDQVAVVTGGSRGMGKAIAIKLAEQGATVVINYNSNAEKANEVVKAIEEAGGKGLAIQGNVASFEETKAIIDQVMKEFGKIDILVNNAGITKDMLLLRMSEEMFMDVVNVNLKGAFNCTKHVSRYMLKQRAGSIINITSVVGITGNAGQCNYAASKAGVIGLTKSVAKELAGKGVRVNAIAPGFIDTDMTEVLPEKIQQDILTKIPLGRLGNPEEVANVAAFLASNQASYVTGQVLCVDGGMVM